MAEPEIESISYSRKKATAHNRKKDNTSNLKRISLMISKKTAVNVDNR